MPLCCQHIGKLLITSECLDDSPAALCWMRSYEKWVPLVCGRKWKFCCKCSRQLCATALLEAKLMRSVQMMQYWMVPACMVPAGDDQCCHQHEVHTCQHTTICSNQTSHTLATNSRASMFDTCICGQSSAAVRTYKMVHVPGMQLL